MESGCSFIVICESHPKSLQTKFRITASIRNIRNNFSFEMLHKVRQPVSRSQRSDLKWINVGERVVIHPAVEKFIFKNAFLILQLNLWYFQPTYIIWGWAWMNSHFYTFCNSLSFLDCKWLPKPKFACLSIST